MDHVGDRGRRERHLLVGVQLHALVLGHLTHRAAQDVDQRDGLAPGAPGLLTADDDEVLLVPAQLARRRVQFVQALQDLGVGVLALQGVQLAELHVDQVLALPGDAQDHLLEAAPGVGQFDGGVHGGALRRVERLGDLAEFVAAVVQRRGRRLHVDLLAPLQPRHHVRQPLLGQAQGGQPQPAQPPRQRARDAPGHADAQEQGDEPAGAEGGGRDQQLARLVGAAVEEPARLLPDQFPVGVGDLRERRGPLLPQLRQVDPVRTVRRAGREHPVLDPLEGLPLGAGEDPLGLRLRAAAQGGDDLVLDQPAPGVHQLREVRPLLLVHPVGRPGQGEPGVLLGGQFGRVLQGDQRPGLRGEVAVVDLGQFLEGVDLLVDDRGVLVERLLGGDVARVVDLVAVVLQAAHRAEHRVQPVRDPGGRVLDRVGLADQLGDLLVRLPALRLQFRPVALGRGQPGGRQAALLLEGERRLGAHGPGVAAQFGLRAQPQALREHLDRRHPPHGGQRDAGHQGQEDQGETYGAEAAPGSLPCGHRRPRRSSGKDVRGAGEPAAAGPGHRVPPAANFATVSAFVRVTNAGPVSTGATPPPLTLPLVWYSQSASTAR